MTQVLASIRNEQEARLVLSTADVGVLGVLDMKEPNNGALGALRIEQIAAINKAVDGRCMTSATIGDLPAKPDVIIDAVKRTIECGVTYVKVGLLGSEYLDKCVPALRFVAKETKLIGVLFADRFEHLDGPCRLLKSAGFSGVMVDTADKTAGSVFSITSYSVLDTFVTTARHLNMLCGIAGSLGIEDIEPAVSLAPDYIGFRRALCGNGNRNDGIDVQAVSEVVGRVAKHAHSVSELPSATKV